MNIQKRFVLLLLTLVSSSSLAQNETTITTDGDNSGIFVSSDSCPAAFASCSEAAPCYDHALGVCGADGSIDTQLLPDCSQATPFCDSCFPNSRCGGASEEDGASGMQNDPSWLLTCAEGFQKADYKIDRMDRFNEWMDENSALDVIRIGYYQGVDDIKEYVGFLYAPFLDFFNVTEVSTVIPIAYSKEECSMLAFSPVRLQVNTKYSENGVGECREFIVTQIITYTVDDNGNGFYLKSHYIDWPKAFIQSTFNGIGNEYPKRFCDTFRDACPLEYQENGLDDESCISIWNDLPEVGDEGLIDENNKACRVLHSEFALANNKHCPHISYIPMKDYLNRTKCQISTTNQTEVLSETNLATRDALRLSLGFDSSLVRTCEYSSTWGEVTVGSPSPDYVGEAAPLSEEDGSQSSNSDESLANGYSFSVARLAVPTLLAGLALL